jgi:hypothetical protein
LTALTELSVCVTVGACALSVAVMLLICACAAVKVAAVNVASMFRAAVIAFCWACGVDIEETRKQYVR